MSFLDGQLDDMLLQNALGFRSDFGDNDEDDSEYFYDYDDGGDDVYGFN